MSHYWKSHLQHHHHHHHHHHRKCVGGGHAQDNESVSSLEAMRKMKFQKSGSVASSDDPDLLEVLSQCGSGGEAANESQDDMLDEEKDKAGKSQDYDECQNEFEMWDCDCTDGDASSASGGGGVTATPVILRKKYTAPPPILVPRTQRSHSLDHYHSPHPLLHPRKVLPIQHHAMKHKERGQLSLVLRQEPFQSLLSPSANAANQLHHFVELPSPSSASLHSGLGDSGGIQELCTKSNSAPMLLKEREMGRRFDNFEVPHLVSV